MANSHNGVQNAADAPFLDFFEFSKRQLTEGQGEGQDTSQRATEEEPAESPAFRALLPWVRALMSDGQVFDASHDFTHIRRVMRNARHILAVESARPDSPKYDGELVLLAALLHDADDRKYCRDRAAMQEHVSQALKSAGAPDRLAAAVQLVCANVSNTHERAHPDQVARVLEAHPELGIVQDADRLDAIGAVGIARVFSYGGALSARGSTRCLGDSVDHFDEKLLHLHALMKTGEGRRLAEERTRRLQTFKDWFHEEE